jgi:hypothetical protein
MAAPARRLRCVASHLAAEPAAAEAEPQPFAAGWPQHISPPQYKAVPRFAVGDRAVLEHLEEHGFAVVGDVLTEAETETALGKVWDFMENMGTGIDRSRPETWSNEFWMENSAPGSGLMSGHGGTHSEALWYVRGIPAVKSVWATLLDDNDLIVSFDGMCQYRPWALDNSWRTSTGWFHCDRQPGPPVTDMPARAGDCGIHERDYVQGFVNLVRTTEATGGNVVCAGSHKRYAETAQEYAGNGELALASLSLCVCFAGPSYPTARTRPVLTLALWWQTVQEILKNCPEIFEESVIAHLVSPPSLPASFPWRAHAANGQLMSATAGDRTIT